jgi:MinD-like ATPase involved in chromosome partitioning or flagellar assembly
MDDHYLILGVESDAILEAIQERFDFLAQAFDPDKYSSLKQKILAEEELQKINNAYQILSNPRKRADYDLQRKSRANYSKTSADDVDGNLAEAARQRAQKEQTKKSEETTHQPAPEAEKRAEEGTNQLQRAINKRKIVAIHSFSAGNGKSTICANLAAQISMAEKRVGVTDTNFQSPGIDLHFDLNESKISKTMNDFLHAKATIREIGYSIGENTGNGDGRAKLAGKKLWLFPASIRAGEISRILKEGVDFNKLNAGLQATITEFDLDYLFIETRSGLNEETLLTFATVDILIVILRPDQQDLQGTSVTIDIARTLDVQNLLLMVNKSFPKYDAAEIKKDIEAQFNIAVAGVLPLSFDLAENASNDLFSLRYPDHEWSKRLREVAEAILAVQ